jgi:hypothetical protein
VRATLAAWQQDKQQPGAASKAGARFSMAQLPSPSSGLRYKVLLLPANPATRQGHVLANPSLSVILGRSGLRLGLLPVKDSSALRPANIITRPDHPFWDITGGDVAGRRGTGV